MDSSSFAKLVKCPLCACGNPEDAMLCTYCCAILDFDSDGELLADGILCGQCGLELKVESDRCAGCGEPLRQMCPACWNENLRLRDRKCPDCGERREAFFEACRRWQEDLDRKSRDEQRKRPRINLLVNLPVVLAFTAAACRAWLDGRPREGIALLFLAALFLMLALMTFAGVKTRRSENRSAWPPS